MFIEHLLFAGSTQITFLCNAHSPYSPFPYYGISIPTQMKGEKAKVHQLCFLKGQTWWCLGTDLSFPSAGYLPCQHVGDGLLTRDKSPVARTALSCRCHLSLMTHEIQNPQAPGILVSLSIKKTTEFMDMKVII